MLIARFEGMYYRNDWPETYPDGYWVPTLRYYRNLPVEELSRENILYIGTSFEYHCSWNALFDAWIKYQTKFRESYPGENLLENRFFIEFIQGLASEDLLKSWKGLVKGCHNYLSIYNI